MKLYWQLCKLFIDKVILGKDKGTVIKNFCERMGVVYIKFAQMLATQNYGNLFTEEDRKSLENICDECNPISYEKVEVILRREYGTNLENIFTFIDPIPIGSASISQVHRAILKSGQEVALKVKRGDVVDYIQNEIARLKRIVHRFGKFVGFGNFVGSDRALELFEKWIMEEVNFSHEKENIKLYQNFADNINGKVENTKQIKVPQLYEQYCTENIIVMEFIHCQTINHMELSEDNRNKVKEAINSYFKLSFHALFNDQQVVFHGDPHLGNIYIDDHGNIGFLDMGLLFALTDEEAQLIRNFFLSSYSGNVEKLYSFLIDYAHIDGKQMIKFKKECQKYCKEVKNKDYTCYFTDMINICIHYEFLPPDFLFCMAKALVCLNGINHFTNNNINATLLVKEQVMEFLVKRSLYDCKNIAIRGLHLAPKLFQDSLKYGLVKTIAKEVSTNDDVKILLENAREMLELYMVNDEEENIWDNPKQKRKI